MRIAVAGGTGVCGRYVVEALDKAGHETVVLSRSNGVDLVTGSGLEAALTGADAVVDASNVTTQSRRVAVDFFDRAGHRLITTSETLAVRHIVSLSIVGVDRVRNPYYAGKLRQEELVRSGGVPWTILRVTQFHEFAGQVLAQVPGPLALVPIARVQPIAAREAGAALAALAAGPAQGMAPELAGPRPESLVDMARGLIRSGHARRRPVLPVYFPGGMSRGGLLPASPGPRGTQTYADWLLTA